MSSANPTTGPIRGPIRAPVSAQARLTIEEAFDRFATTVTPDDRRQFQDTRLEDVRTAALQIEEELAARRSLRNMRRLYPFLQGLEHYSKSVEVLCNGTPYLPWIWAPVKLMLQISSDSLSAFEKLIEAYGKIADALPRFDRLSAALKDDHDFQVVVALMYADILEFHRRAYKFVRRRSWKFFFGSMWANFDTRFRSILANLAYHSDLVDKEAISIDIAASSKRRKEDVERFEKQEQEWKSAKLSATLSWLGFGSHVVDDKVDNLTRDCSPGICDWLLEHPKIKPWMQNQGPCSVVWLHGKPGAGKSVLSASLVQHLEETSSEVFFYFCSYFDAAAGTSAYLFRSLVAQIVQAHQDTAVYVSDHYITSYRAASRKALTSLLPELLTIVGPACLVVDGIDEWDSKEQQVILDDILPLATVNGIKVFISSRDMPIISRMMRRKKKVTAVLSLSEEHAFIDRSIKTFIARRLDDYRSNLQDLDPNSSTLSDVHNLLMEKSNGMFLWVRLVLDSLDSVYTPEDLRKMLTSLPSDLSDLYERIIGKICDSRNGIRHNRASAILRWICFAQRPIRLSELLHGLTLAPGESNPDIGKVPIPEILELCKPLVEQRPDGTVGFVHFSVQEYLQSEASVISNSADAHLLISFACVTTLSHGLSLLHPEVNAQDRRISIVHGVYGLMMYALEFWQQHILSYAANGGDLSPNANLIKHLSSFWSTHERIRSAKHDSGIGVPAVDATIASEPQEARLHLVAHLPIFTLICDTLQLRLASQNEASSDAIEVFAINNDRTLLSQLAVDFESWILYLLSQTSISGVPEEWMVKFQMAFASSAFRCRYPFCHTSSIGFATAAYRRKHEASHLLRVYCSITLCPWSRIGFKDQTALRNHVRDNHTKDSRLLAPAGARLWSANASIETMMNQRRLQLRDDWPPVFSYERKDDAGSLAEMYLDKISPNYMRQGPDWFAFFEPHNPRVLDVELVHTMRHPDVICSSRFSACGLYVATCSNREIKVFNVSTGAEVQFYSAYGLNFNDDNFMRDVCFHPDSMRVIGVGDDKIVRIWNLGGQLHIQWRAHEDNIYAVDVSNDGNFIVTGSYDRTAKIWNSKGGGPENFHSDELVEMFHSLTHEVGVADVAFSPDCRLLVTATQDCVVYVWDVTSASMTAKLTGHLEAVYSISFSPSGSHILSGSIDKTVRLWELDPSVRKTSEKEPFGGTCIKTIEGHADFVLSATTTPDGSWIISGGKDCSVRMINADTGALQCILVGHTNTVMKVRCHPTGAYFITVSGDKTARIWRYGPYVKPPREDEEQVLAAEPAPMEVENTVDEDRPITIKCICGLPRENDGIVLCEKCGAWQHIACYYKSPQYVPNVHECTDCFPRPLDSKRAFDKQG